MTRPRLHTGAPPSAADYLAQLRADLAVFQRWGAQPYAGMLVRVIADLEAQADAAEAEELTLRGAAQESGYSEDHLGRLVRAGSLRNYGRAGSPRVRRGELPRRPQRLQSGGEASTVGASKAAIARSITGAR